MELRVNVLMRLFNPDVNQASPNRIDKVRVVKRNEKGEEIVSYEDFDAHKYQESLGPVDNWSLESLMKAGINPDFPIHTGDTCRLQSAGVADEWAIAAEEVLSESNVEESNNN